MAKRQDTKPEAEPQLTSSVSAEPPAPVAPEPPPPAPPSPSEVGLADTSSMVPPEMPPVQQHSIDAVRAAKAEEAEAVAGGGDAQSTGIPVKGKTDDKGRPFAPGTLHEVGPDGGPVINARGFIKQRRGGAAQANARVSFAKTPTPGNAPEARAAKLAQQAQELEAKIQSTAEVSAYLFITGTQIIGGDEFEPESDEPSMLKGAFANYYRMRGVVDLPPELIVGQAMLGYVVKRWNKPKFAEKRKGWWQWLKRNVFKGQTVATDTDDIKPADGVEVHK